MPFFKFLVKFPPEAVNFFLMRLSDVEMSRLFHVSCAVENKFSLSHVISSCIPYVYVFAADTTEEAHGFSNTRCTEK